MQSLLHSVPPTLRQATTKPHACWRLLDTTGRSGSASCWLPLPPPRPWCAQGFVCALQASLSPVLCKFCPLYGGLMATSSKRVMPYPGLLHPEPLPLWQATAAPHLCKRHSNTVLAPSLWGLWVLVRTMFVWALWASLVGMGFDSKCDFTSPPILLGLLPCRWMWGIFFLVGSNISCQWLFSSKLSFWSSRRRRWAHVFLLHHLGVKNFATATSTMTSILVPT